MSSANSESINWSRNSAPYATKQSASIDTCSPRQAQSRNAASVSASANANDNNGGYDPSELNLLAALESEDSTPLADVSLSQKREAIQIPILEPKQHRTYSCSLTLALVDELEIVHSPVYEVSDESAVLDEIVTLHVSSDRDSSPAVNTPSTESAPSILEPLDLSQNTVSFATISPTIIQRQPEQIPFIGDVDLYSDISNYTSQAYLYNSDSSQSPKLVICESTDDEHDDTNPGLTLQMESSPLCVTPNILDSELVTIVSEAASNSMFEIDKTWVGYTDNSGPSDNTSQHESQPPTKALYATTKGSNSSSIVPGVKTQNINWPTTKYKQQDCKNIKPSDDDRDVNASRISIRKNHQKMFLKSDEDELNLPLSPPKKIKYTKPKPVDNPSPKSNQCSSLMDKYNNIKKSIAEKRRNSKKVIPISSPPPTKSSTPVKISDCKILKKVTDSTGSTDSNKTETSDLDCEKNHDADGSKRLRTDASLNSDPLHSQLKIPPRSFSPKTIKGRPATRINPVGYCQIKSYLKRQPDHQWALEDPQIAKLNVNINTATATNPAASKTTLQSQPPSSGNTNRLSETKNLAQNNMVENTMLVKRERCKAANISPFANMHENLQTSAMHDTDGRKTLSKSRPHSISQASVRELSPPLTVKSTAGAFTKASEVRDSRFSASQERENVPVPVHHSASGTRKIAQPNHQKSMIESSRSQLSLQRHTLSNQETMSRESKASARSNEQSSRKSSPNSHTRPNSCPQSPSHANSKHPHKMASEKEWGKSESTVGERKSIYSHERRKSICKLNFREKFAETHTNKSSHSYSRAQSPLSKSKSSQDHDKSVGRPEIASVSEKNWTGDRESMQSYSSHPSSPHSKSKHDHERKVVSDSHYNSSGKSSRRDHQKTPSQIAPSQYSKPKHEHDEATVKRNKASGHEKTHGGKSTSHHCLRSSPIEDRDKHKDDSGMTSVIRSSPKENRDKHKVYFGSSSPKEDCDKHKVYSGSLSVSRSPLREDHDKQKFDSGLSSGGGLFSSKSHSRPSSPRKTKRIDSHEKEEIDKVALDETLKPFSSKERRKSVSHSCSHPTFPNHTLSNTSINPPENDKNAPLEEKVISTVIDRFYLAPPLHTLSSTGTNQLKKCTSTKKCVSEDAPLIEKGVCLYHPASPPYVPANTSTNQPKMNTNMKIAYFENASLNENQTSRNHGHSTSYIPFYTTTNQPEKNTNNVKDVSPNDPIIENQVSSDPGRWHTETLCYTLSNTSTNQPEKEACVKKPVSEDASIKAKPVSIDQGRYYSASRPYAPSHACTNQSKMDAYTRISVVGTLKEKPVSSDQGRNHPASIPYIPSNISTNQTEIDRSKEKSVSDNAIQIEKETSCDQSCSHPLNSPYTQSKTNTHQPEKQIGLEISIPEKTPRIENQVVSKHGHYSLASLPYTPFYTSTIQPGKGTSIEKSIAEVVPRKGKCDSSDHDRDTPASTHNTPSNTITNQLGKDTSMKITMSKRAPQIENQVSSNEGRHRLAYYPHTQYYNSTTQSEKCTSRECSIGENVLKKETGVSSDHDRYSSASSSYTPSNTSTNQSEEKTCIGISIFDYAPQKKNPVFSDQGSNYDLYSPDSHPYIPACTNSINLENGMNSEKSISDDALLKQNRICSNHGHSQPASTPHTSSKTSTNPLEKEKCCEISVCKNNTLKQKQVSRDQNGNNPACRPFAPSITCTNHTKMGISTQRSKDSTLKETQVWSNQEISNSESPTRSPSPQGPTVQDQELAKQIKEHLLEEVSANSCPKVYQNRTNNHVSGEVVINASYRTSERSPQDDKQKLVHKICCSENVFTRTDIISFVTMKNDNSRGQNQQQPEVSSIDPADAPTRMNTPHLCFKVSESDSVTNVSAVFSNEGTETPVGMYHIDNVNLPGHISQWIENLSPDLIPQPNSVTLYTAGTKPSKESDHLTVETTQLATVPCAVAALPRDVSVVKTEIETIDITGDDIKEEPAVLKCRSPRNLGVLTAEEDRSFRSLTECLQVGLAAYKYHAHITSIVNSGSGSQVILEQVQRQLKQTLAVQAKKLCIIVNKSKEMFKRNQLFPKMLRIVNAESEIKYKECDLKTVIKMLVSFDDSLFTTLYTNPLSGVGVPGEASAEIDTILNNVCGNGSSCFETNGTTSNNCPDQLLAPVVPEYIPDTQPAECQTQYQEPMQMNYRNSPSLLHTIPTEINAGLAASATWQGGPSAMDLHSQSDSVNPLSRMPVDLYNGQSGEQQLVDAMFSQPINDLYYQMHAHPGQHQRLIPQNTTAVSNQNRNTNSYQMPILTEQLPDRNAQEVRNRNFQMQQAIDQYRRMAQFNNGNKGCSPRSEPRLITSIQQDATAHGMYRNKREVEMQQESQVTSPTCQRENPWGIAQQQNRVADCHPSSSVPGIAVVYAQRPPNMHQAPHQKLTNLSPNNDTSSMQPRNIQPSYIEIDKQTYRPPSRTTIGRERGGKNRGRGHAVHLKTGAASTMPNTPTNQYVPPPPYNENIPCWTNEQYPPRLFSHEAANRPYTYPVIPSNNMRQPPEHHPWGASLVHKEGPPKDKKGRSWKLAKHQRQMESKPLQLKTPASSHVPVTTTIPPTYNTAAHYQHIPGMVFRSDLPPGQRTEAHVLKNLLTGYQVFEMSELPNHNKRQALNSNAYEQVAQARAERHVPQPVQSFAADRRMPPVERPQPTAPAAPLAQQLLFNLLHKQIVEGAKNMNTQGEKSAAQDHRLNFSHINNSSGERFDNIQSVPIAPPNVITNQHTQAAQNISSCLPSGTGPPRVRHENSLRLVRSRMWKLTQTDQSPSNVAVPAVNTSPLVSAAIMPQFSAPSAGHAVLPSLMSLKTSVSFQNKSHRAILSMPDLSTSYFSNNISAPRSAEPTTEENISENNIHAVQHTTPTLQNIGFLRSTTLHPAADVISDDDDESSKHSCPM